MKLYLDTGSVDEIKKGAETGVLDGVTTNPSLIAKEGTDFNKTIKQISSILSKTGTDFTVSAEVTETETKKMIAQGLKLAKLGSKVLVKVPSGINGIPVVKELSKRKIRTNVTLCFSVSQALLAAKAGAYVVSPFIGRIDDISWDGMQLIKDIRKVYDQYGFKTQILAASIRHPVHVTESAKVGADIATMPYGVFEKLFKHPLTDIGLDKFMKDWKKYEARK